MLVCVPPPVLTHNAEPLGVLNLTLMHYECPAHYSPYWRTSEQDAQTTHETNVWLYEIYGTKLYPSRRVWRSHCKEAVVNGWIRERGRWRWVCLNSDGSQSHRLSFVKPWWDSWYHLLRWWHIFDFLLNFLFRTKKHNFTENQQKLNVF